MLLLLGSCRSLDGSLCFDFSAAGDDGIALLTKFAARVLPFRTTAETEGAFVQGFADQIGNIGKIMKAILSAVFFTILLVAGNTMVQSVRERTGEFAVLKSLGFSDSLVLGLVLAESIVVAGVGGFLGLGLAWVLISLGDPTSGALPIFFFPTDDLIVGIVLVVVLGLVTGLPPALSAGRLHIAEALRRL